MRRIKPPPGFVNVSDPVTKKGVYVMYAPSEMVGPRLWLEPWWVRAFSAECAYGVPTFRSRFPLMGSDEHTFEEIRKEVEVEVKEVEL